MSNNCNYCISLRSASMACALITLLYSLAMITASTVSIFKYGSSLSSFVLAAFEIKGIADFITSILCIRGVCTESGNFLLPWIFTISVGTVFMFLVAISYMMYATTSYTVFGIVIFTAAVFFSAGWICVLSYYYQLYDKKQNRLNGITRNRRSNGNVAEISRTSFSVVSENEDGIVLPPPPAYNVIFKNPAFELDEFDGDNKLPSYDEVVAGSKTADDAESRRY